MLAGSTDIRVETPERVRCEPEERDYILDSLRLVFPDIVVSPGDVVFSYSGIRPLPKSDHQFTGRISRGHFVHRLDGAVPQFCMVGGKWTTFRAFAEQTADVVLAELGRQRVRGTLDLPIGGGLDFPKGPAALEDALVEAHGIERDRAAYLADMYGTRAAEVLRHCLGEDDDVSLDGVTATTAAEVRYLIRNEFVVEPGDILLRRTAHAIRGEISTRLVARVAEILARELGWDAGRTAERTRAFLDELCDYHGVSIEMLEQRTKDRSPACA